ncbi:nebulette-like [Astyanax mexicanus]|uniref:Nebulette-like n=1 Tax=Astyanax mexicanus TaxID=7994 RepID=A0A8T2MSJ7_ASTMX|nr:nebulette-like [Astyanax mexicanus]
MDETDSESDLSNCLYSQMAETIQTRFAKELAPTLSEYQYKQEGKKELANCLYALLPKTRETQHAKELSQLYSKKHYKEGGKKDAEACLYAQMPQTIETVFAKEVTNHQSNKLYKEKYNAEKGKSLYASMKTLPAMEHAMEVNKEQSNVNYRKGIQQVHKFHEVADRPDILRAIQATKLASNVAYKNKVDTFKEQALLQRPDIDHAMQAAKVASKVHYKQKFEGDQRAHKPVYNPSDCLSFKHAKAATALISQVQYRKKYEEAKGQYHFSLNTAEHLHHKENSVLQSQVRYRQDYEKNKSKVKMEFGDTQFYRVSKEAQKLQSKKEYCKDYENCIKGKVQMDVESTPGYLSACSANRLLSEKEYCKDLKTEIIGKRVDIGTDAVEIQRAMKTSEITSQKKYKDNAETLKCSYAVMPDTPEMERAKINQRNISSVRYSWDVKHMKRLTLAVTETPEIILAKENTKKISNVKYREEVGSGISVKDTLEMERVRRNQMNISSVKYREDFERTRGRSCTPALKNTGTGRQVWRTDPGSIFDFDPVEDNIQSRSLRRMSERPGHVSRHSVLSCAESVCSSSVSEEWGDESTSSNSSMSTLRNTPSTASVISDPVQQISQSHHLQPHHQQGYTAVQTVQSTPHLDIMRVYRALYDYTAQDHDEVSFQDGDVIISLQPVDEGWMYGTVQRTGQAGMLPANYVECLS